MSRGPTGRKCTETANARSLFEQLPEPRASAAGGGHWEQRADLGAALRPPRMPGNGRARPGWVRLPPGKQEAQPRSGPRDRRAPPGRPAPPARAPGGARRAREKTRKSAGGVRARPRRAAGARARPGHRPARPATPALLRGAPGPPCPARPASQTAGSRPPPARPGRRGAPRPPSSRRAGAEHARRAAGEAAGPRRGRGKMADFLPSRSVLSVCFPGCVLTSGEAEQQRKSKEIDKCLSREDLREAPGEDPAAGRGRERQVPFSSRCASSTGRTSTSARARSFAPPSTAT